LFDRIPRVDRSFAVLIMAVVGGFIALQAPINAGLGRATGNFAAATISFAIGTVLLAAIVAAGGKAGGRCLGWSGCSCCCAGTYLVVR
jgi:uncharacterized membrane protein YdcZ (DUF606 family)